MKKGIKKQLAKIKKSSGVYIFRDQKNKIIYIGKAKNLRTRVRSYFNGHDNRPLVPKIVSETDKIKIIKTDSEVEAILLESKLIKKIKPPYNSRQKDDKSFIYVFIDFSNPIPKVQFIRQKEVLEGRVKQKKKDKLFGPFTSAYEMKKLLNYFRSIIPFRDCSDSKFKGYQKLNRGCQWAELGKCSAPCVGQSDIKEYRQNIVKLSRLLSGKINTVNKDFMAEMKANSKEKNYEKAAEARDRIKTLKHVKEISLIDDDLHIGVYTSGVYDRMCKNYMVEAVDVSNISGKYAVGSIVKANFKIQNTKSKTNPKFKIQNIKVDFVKSGYRRFKIKTKNQPDDVGMIREVVKRRFNHPEWEFPDLLIIDGGLGQLQAVESEVANNYRSITSYSKINLIAIAKGPARKGKKLFFNQNFDSKLKSTLIKNIKVIKLVRDEAHRFAISYHKILRKKGIIGL